MKPRPLGLTYRPQSAQDGLSVQGATSPLLDALERPSGDLGGSSERLTRDPQAEPPLLEQAFGFVHHESRAHHAPRHPFQVQWPVYRRRLRFTALPTAPLDLFQHRFFAALRLLGISLPGKFPQQDPSVLWIHALNYPF